MPHIHNEPGQHDHTVTLYVVRTDFSEPKVLLHMHRKHRRLLPVGGHIELNETPWQAAAHELTEESGYKLSDLMILQPRQRIPALPKVKLHPYPVVLNTHNITENHFHSDIVYAFVADGEPTETLGSGESTDLRWFTASEIDKLDEPDIFLSTKVVCKFILDECLNNWDKVPASAYEL